MNVVSINAPYERQGLFNFVGEVIEPILLTTFLSTCRAIGPEMPTGEYTTFDQNEYDRKRFYEYSGMKLWEIFR